MAGPPSQQRTGPRADNSHYLFKRVCSIIIDRLLEALIITLIALMAGVSWFGTCEGHGVSRCEPGAHAFTSASPPTVTVESRAETRPPQTKQLSVASARDPSCFSSASAVFLIGFGVLGFLPKYRPRAMYVQSGRGRAAARPATTPTRSATWPRPPRACGTSAHTYSRRF